MSLKGYNPLGKGREGKGREGKGREDFCANLLFFRFIISVLKGKVCIEMQVNKIQSNNNTNFTGFRFTKAAKNHIADTFLAEEVKDLGKIVEEHKNIKPDVLVGTAPSLFGSTRLRARIDGEEIFDNSILFEDGFEFLKDAASYAKEVSEKLGTSISESVKNITKN